jgi:hypothetical protein
LTDDEAAAFLRAKWRAELAADGGGGRAAVVVSAAALCDLISLGGYGRGLAITAAAAFGRGLMDDSFCDWLEAETDAVERRSRQAVAALWT